MSAKNIVMAAAGTDSKTYIEDVFSTYLYRGNSSTQTINNGIDLAGKGGLVWQKGRSGTSEHALVDTVRGSNVYLVSNSAVANQNVANAVTFNSNGFTSAALYGTQTVVSWTFRKAPKFFDVVTYTGDGTTTRSVNHSLGSIPGMVIVKCTSKSSNWSVGHQANTTNWSNRVVLCLNSTDQFNAGATYTSGYVTSANESTFTLQKYSTNTPTSVNESGQTYVAYLFAHDTTTDGLIQCGSVTGVSTVNLGWEPQYLLIKRTDASGNWFVVDTMRGLTVDYAALTGDGILLPNGADAEFASTIVNPTATGFTTNSSGTWIYMAIRRGPMRTPTDATKVFQPSLGATAIPAFTSSFPVDLAIVSYRSGGGSNHYVVDRLRGKISSNTHLTTAESVPDNMWKLDQQTGFAESSGLWGSIHVASLFRRAPGFFDIVCDAGTGTAKTVAHNLGVAPDLIIRKNRNIGGTNRGWWVYSAPTGNAQGLYFDWANAQLAIIWNNTTPTKTSFSVDGSYLVNESGAFYVSYLFASCPGISKVGSYTGNGSSQTINCGFAAGARFVLIKRTDLYDSTSNWYLWDSARGIVSGYDPHLSLNTVAAEVTSNDSIDPDSTGFIVNQVAGINVNVSGATYIYLAIA